MASTDPVDELEIRRRKLRFRAWHRGTREMDLVTGRFADASLAHMTKQELDEFETLLEAPDPDLFAWVVGQALVPVAYDTPIFRRIMEFHGTVKGTSAR